MKKRLKFLMVLTVGLMLALPGLAVADLVTVGDTVVTGSFTQHFDENGYYGGYNNFDRAVATCVGGAGFEYATSGWNTTYNFGEVTFSSGAGPQGDLPFSLTCNGSINEPFSFDWCGYQGGEQVFEDYVCWDGHRWTCEPCEHHCVPIPPTALLLGSGLLSLVGLGWRRKQSQ